MNRIWIQNNLNIKIVLAYLTKKSNDRFSINWCRISWPGFSALWSSCVCVCVCEGLGLGVSCAEGVGWALQKCRCVTHTPRCEQTQIMVYNVSGVQRWWVVDLHSGSDQGRNRMGDLNTALGSNLAETCFKALGRPLHKESPLSVPTACIFRMWHEFCIVLKAEV